MAEVRDRRRGARKLAARGRADRPRRGLRGARASRWRRASGENAEPPNEHARASIERQTGETDVRLSLALEGTGAGTRETGVGLPRPHARPARAPRPHRPRRAGQRRPADRRAPHRRGHRDRARPGARRGARRPRAASSATARRRCRWTRRARAARSTSPGGPFTLFEADLPPGSTGGFEHELTEEFFRALANAAKLTLHLRVEAGTNAHHMIEAAFKAFARALRQAVAIDPSETGVPSTKGTLTA